MRLRSLGHLNHFLQILIEAFELFFQFLPLLQGLFAHRRAHQLFRREAHCLPEFVVSSRLLQAHAAQCVAEIHYFLPIVLSLDFVTVQGTPFGHLPIRLYVYARSTKWLLRVIERLGERCQSGNEAIWVHLFYSLKIVSGVLVKPHP